MEKLKPVFSAKHDFDHVKINAFSTFCPLPRKETNETKKMEVAKVKIFR